MKWVEQAGARAVPLGYSWSDEQVDALLAQVNGVLFPGGGSSLPSSARRAINVSITRAEAGETMPVWGICLGFEWVAEAVGKIHSTGGFDAENFSIPLNLDVGLAAKSRMLGDSPELREALIAEPITMNNHRYGVPPSAFSGATALGKFFDVLSTNYDRSGKVFVSTIEASDDRYAIFGTQWHPEKAQFEFGISSDGTPYEAQSHSVHAVAVSQHLANLFVAQARRSTRTFTTSSAERDALITNRGKTRGSALFTHSASKPEFEQTYYLHL